MASVPSDDITWEPDPLIFRFKDEIPGQVKMHTRFLDHKVDWIRIDKTYVDQMKLRKTVLEENRSEVWVSRDDLETAAAKLELLQEVGHHITRRFPYLFQSEPDGDGLKIHNRALGTTTSTSSSDPLDPLIRLNQLTQEDWVLMGPSKPDFVGESEKRSAENEPYVLCAGIVCFPNYWSLREKFEGSIPVIHDPVKSFKLHLEDRVMGLLRKLQTEKPMWRANWGILNDLNGPLDLYTPTSHAARNDTNATTVYKGSSTGRELLLRTEYQTLHRLLKSQFIVFSSRTYQRYLAEFENYPVEDCVALIRAINNLDPDVAEYKGAGLWQDAAVKYLESVIASKIGVTISKKKSALRFTVIVVLGLVASIGFTMWRMKTGQA